MCTIQMKTTEKVAITGHSTGGAKGLIRLGIASASPPRLQHQGQHQHVVTRILMVLMPISLHLFFLSFPFVTCSAFLTTAVLARPTRAFAASVHMPNSKNSNSEGPFDEGTRFDEGEVGKLERLKQREAELSRLLSAIRQEKLSALRSRPLTIGVVGFGRFGQFISRTFALHNNVVVTSRSDYSDVARGMGVKYVPLSDPLEFLSNDLDVIVLAVSIVSFEDTVRSLVPHLQDHIGKNDGFTGEARNDTVSADEASVALKGRGPLVVDVLSVKEHPRKILLDLLPVECDILCTHPMFGPDSGKDGWHGLNFVFERTRINGVLLDPSTHPDPNIGRESSMMVRSESFFLDAAGTTHSVHEHSEEHVEAMDRMERFLSIWEEEGCRMVPLSCREHDEFAANSQFMTHLMGRILGAQGLQATPIDTKGFESVLKLIGNTKADSFDLFYGLYKYNQNSMETIIKLRNAMDDVVMNLKLMEERDTNAPHWLPTMESSLKERTVSGSKKDNESLHDDQGKGIKETCFQ